jgi:putative membrane protein
MMGRKHSFRKRLARAARRRQRTTLLGLGAAVVAGLVVLLLRSLSWRRLRVRGHALALRVRGQDGGFVLCAAREGTAAVELGHLGAKLGERDDVRQFGLRLAREHGQLNDELMHQAFARGVAPPIGLDGRRRAQLARLGRLAGDRFDRAYMDAMIDVHREAVALFRAEARSGEDPAFRALAGRALPLLAEHLRDAESLKSSRGPHRSRR